METLVGHEIVEKGPAERVSGGSPHDPDPDRELVAHWRGGDDPAFEALVRRYQGRVYRLLVRMIGAAEAEDVAQEAFLNLYRRGRRFRGDARFSTYVYRIAVNAALNRRRSLGRRRDRTRELEAQQAAATQSSHPETSPEEALRGRELRDRVARALASLPPKLRAPLVLHDVEGLRYEDVARVLRLAEGTVKSRIHRARMALRDQLSPLLATRESEGEA